MAAAMFKANPNAFQTLERLAAAAERRYVKAIRELERGRDARWTEWSTIRKQSVRAPLNVMVAGGLK